MPGPQLCIKVDCMHGERRGEVEHGITTLLLGGVAGWLRGEFEGVLGCSVGRCQRSMLALLQLGSACANKGNTTNSKQLQLVGKVRMDRTCWPIVGHQGLKQQEHAQPRRRDLSAKRVL